MASLTVEIDEHAALARHIEDLQRVITKRNEEIQRLTDRLEAGEGSAFVHEAYERGKRDGWRECSLRLQNVTLDAARALGTIRKEAFDTYLAGERASRSSGGDS